MTEKNEAKVQTLCHCGEPLLNGRVGSCAICEENEELIAAIERRMARRYVLREELIAAVERVDNTERDGRSTWARFANELHREPYRAVCEKPFEVSGPAGVIRSGTKCGRPLPCPQHSLAPIPPVLAEPVDAQIKRLQFERDMADRGWCQTCGHHKDQHILDSVSGKSGCNYSMCSCEEWTASSPDLSTAEPAPAKNESIGEMKCRFDNHAAWVPRSDHCPRGTSGCRANHPLYGPLFDSHEQRGKQIVELEAEIERLQKVIPTCSRGPKACDALIAELEKKLSDTLSSFAKYDTSTYSCRRIDEMRQKKERAELALAHCEERLVMNVGRAELAEAKLAVRDEQLRLLCQCSGEDDVDPSCPIHNDKKSSSEIPHKPCIVEITRDNSAWWLAHDMTTTRVCNRAAVFPDGATAVLAVEEYERRYGAVHWKVTQPHHHQKKDNASEV